MLRGSALFALLFAIAWLRSDAVAVVEGLNEATQENRSSMLHSSYYRLQSETYLQHLRTSFGAAITWAKKHVSDAIDHTGIRGLRRPIITGCLKQCGYEEQSCVTQCQVCMEQNQCRILGDCAKCMGEARAMKLRFRRADKTILDSGGIAMVRDGLMAEMTEARLKALDMKRRLRKARENVLQAQREAEYASQERHTRAQNLKEATQALKGSKLEVTRWKLQNEKKLKAARTKAREQRQERQRAERKLEREKRKYSKAKRRLRVASNNASAMNASQDDAEVWESTREVEQRRQAVEDAEMQVEQTSADGEWLDRGLQRRVRSSERGAKKAREELLEGRARERVSQDSLQEAKEKYMQATKASQRADEVAEEMEAKLRQAPLQELDATPSRSAAPSAAHESTRSLSVAPESTGIEGVAPESSALLSERTSGHYRHVSESDGLIEESDDLEAPRPSLQLVNLHTDAQAMRTADDKDGHSRSRGSCTYFSLFVVLVMIGSSEWQRAAGS